jgi:hypothetical protein
MHRRLAIVLAIVTVSACVSENENGKPAHVDGVTCTEDHSVGTRIDRWTCRENAKIRDDHEVDFADKRTRTQMFFLR